MDEETKKLLQNMAQQQARMADAANTTIDKKPFTVNLHILYGALAVLAGMAWVGIGWIKDVDAAMLKTKQAPVEVESVKTNVETVKASVATAQGDIKDLRRITTETDARLTKQEASIQEIREAIRAVGSDQAKVLGEIQGLKKDVGRILENRR